MFDIGFAELLLIGVISLVVLGPERLPGAMRTTGLWLGRIRRTFRNMKADIEREIGADEIKRQLHNEEIMQNIKKMESQIPSSGIYDIGSAVSGQSAASAPAEPEAKADQTPTAGAERDDAMADFTGSVAPNVVDEQAKKSEPVNGQ